MTNTQTTEQNAQPQTLDSFITNMGRDYFVNLLGGDDNITDADLKIELRMRLMEVGIFEGKDGLLTKLKIDSNL